MAKFAVALCILLVACSGTQGNWFNPLVNWVEERLEKLDARREEAVDKLQEIFNQISNIRRNFLEEMNTRVENLIAQVEAGVEEFSTNAQELRECGAEAIDFKNRAMEVAQSVDNCAIEAQINVELSYGEAKDAIDAYKAVAAQTKANFDECLKENNILVCGVQNGRDFFIESEDEWNTVAEKTKTLIQDVLTYQTTLQLCVSTDGLVTLQENAKAINAGLRDCVANLRDE